MTPDELMVAAIGAVVAAGDEIVGRAYTSDRSLGRRLVHADLLAMHQADERGGRGPLRIAVNLEPRVECVGAAMVLGVTEVYFGLWSPETEQERLNDPSPPGQGSSRFCFTGLVPGLKPRPAYVHRPGFSVGRLGLSPLRCWAAAVCKSSRAVPLGSVRIGRAGAR